MKNAMLQSEKVCSRDLKSCPPGHQISRCGADGNSGYYCMRCSGKTFQPDVNKMGDKCRFRRSCRKRHMQYRDRGGVTRDADCMCEEGFHFESVDQRACVPNAVCPIGFGQTFYGQCQDCRKIYMYSSVEDRFQPCQRLTNCAVQGRCLSKPSDGTDDNKCGKIVKDISQCSTGDQVVIKEILIVGCVLGVLVVVLGALFAFIYSRVFRRHKNYHMGVLSTEDVLRNVIETAKGDKLYATKVLDKSVAVIADTIPKQEWLLATKLFEEHDDYSADENKKVFQGKTTQQTVRCYLKMWREWKGDNAESITVLFDYIRECNRYDILAMICKQLRRDFDIELNKYNLSPVGCSPKKPKRSIFCWKMIKVFAPEEKKPLHISNDITVHVASPKPSAPVTEDSIKYSSANLFLPYGNLS